MYMCQQYEASYQFSMCYLGICCYMYLFSSLTISGTHWLMDSIAMLMRGKAEVVPQTADGFLDLLADLNLLAQKGTHEAHSFDSTLIQRHDVESTVDSIVMYTQHHVPVG